VILIIIAIYVVSSYLIRLILPVLVRNTIRGLQNNMHRDRPEYQDNIKRQEGEVTIEILQKKNNDKSSKEEEYIDFEEVK